MFKRFEYNNFYKGLFVVRIMKAPEGFNPNYEDNLIANLNLNSDNPDYEFLLIDGKDKSLRLRNICHCLEGVSINSARAYTLAKTRGGNFGWDYDEKIGSIFVENGTEERSENYRTWLSLELNKPIKLANGLEIPPCKIKLDQSLGDGYSYPAVREDSLARGGVWNDCDLEAYLPTEWFTRKSD
jgi:hypothetical protein